MKDLSIYIHIPFCKTLCLYCNFLTFAHKNKQIPQYIDAVTREILEHADEYRNYQVETIYFGGGTPSLVDASFISGILDALRRNFNISPNPEISIECNPESLDENKLERYRTSGINRISLGIQSFDRKTLLRIARPHDNIMIFRALDHIKKSGIRNFGADFIMGLPCQTPDSFKDELETILNYNPPHLSFYFLSYDTEKIDIFKSDCPSEDSQIEMYEHLSFRLKEKGYVHYEVSNYCLPGFECLHNQRYWDQKDYLGIGLGAHSIVNGKGWENGSDFGSYIAAPLQTVNEIIFDEDLKRMEHIMLKLRTHQGIDRKSYQPYGKWNTLLANAAPYLATQRLVQDKDSLKPTESGFLILDRIIHDLL